MLNQLLEQLEQIVPVTDRIKELLARAEIPPKSPDDLAELVKLTNFKLSPVDFPAINHMAIEKDIYNCKQVLIPSDNYFYI